MRVQEKNTKKTRVLKRARESKDVSLRELADILDINYSVISYWERGYRYPSKENQEKLEKFFGRSIDDLMEEETNEA